MTLFSYTARGFYHGIILVHRYKENWCKIRLIFLEFFHIQSLAVPTHLWHIHASISNTMLSSVLLFFDVNNVSSMLNHILVPFKIPIKLNIIVTTMHIAHRVTNAYPSSVQSTQFFRVQHSYMMANQQPLMGRHTVVSGMLQGEKHIQFRTHEKGMFYIFFSYNASLSLSFKIFPFTWEHFPVSLKFFKENHFFQSIQQI